MCYKYSDFILTPGTSFGIAVVAEPLKGPAKQQHSIYSRGL